MTQDMKNKVGELSIQEFVGVWILTSHRTDITVSTLPLIGRVYDNYTFSISVNKGAFGGQGISMTYGDWKILGDSFYLRSNYLVYLEIPGGSMVEHYAKGYACGEVTRFQNKIAAKGSFVDIRYPLDLRDVGVAEEDAFDLGARKVFSGVFEGEKVPEVEKDSLPEDLQYLQVWTDTATQDLGK